MFPSIVVFQMSVVAEERVASLMIRRSATEKAAGSSKSGCGLNSKNLGSKKFVCELRISHHHVHSVHLCFRLCGPDCKLLGSGRWAGPVAYGVTVYDFGHWTIN